MWFYRFKTSWRVLLVSVVSQFSSVMLYIVAQLQQCLYTYSSGSRSSCRRLARGRRPFLLGLALYCCLELEAAAGHFSLFVYIASNIGHLTCRFSFPLAWVST